MIRKLATAATCLALLAATFDVGAADCTETITNLIVHSNGNVYFKTDQTCTNNWCQLNWGAGTKNGYAALLEAQATGRKVWFTW